MKAAIFSNHSPRVGFGVDRKMAVSRSQVMVVAASRNHPPQIKARPSGGLFCVSGMALAVHFGALWPRGADAAIARLSSAFPRRLDSAIQAELGEKLRGASCQSGLFGSPEQRGRTVGYAFPRHPARPARYFSQLDLRLIRAVAAR